MPYLAKEPMFLPLTVSAAQEAAGGPKDTVVESSTRGLLHSAVEANSAAADCWVALIAGCHSPARRVLRSRLRELSEATSEYAGTRWWLGPGSVHRRKVDDAESRIGEAVRESDGAEFAEAFVGYDQAVATAVVCAHLSRSTRAESTLGSPAT